MLTGPAARRRRSPRARRRRRAFAWLNVMMISAAAASARSMPGTAASRDRMSRRRLRRRSAFSPGSTDRSNRYSPSRVLQILPFADPCRVEPGDPPEERAILYGDCSPVQTGSRFSPSSGYAGSGGVPVAARIVAVQSIVIAAWAVTRPAGSVRSSARSPARACRLRTGTSSETRTAS